MIVVTAQAQGGRAEGQVGKVQGPRRGKHRRREKWRNERGETRAVFPRFTETETRGLTLSLDPGLLT